MKLNQALQEAVVRDKKDHYSHAGMIYNLDGRKKHVEEKIEVHILNFGVKKSKGKYEIIPTYVWKKNIFKPIHRGKERSEVYLNKRTNNLQYTRKINAPDYEEFVDFEDFYNFQKREYKKGNKWPYILMKRAISEGWKEVQDKQNRFNRGRNFINALDTIGSEISRLEQAVSFVISKRGVNSLQKYVVIKKYKDIEDRTRYGESVDSTAKAEYNSITRSITAAA